MHQLHHTDDAEFDARIREALDPSTDVDIDAARDHSRYRAAFDLDDAIAGEVRSARSSRAPLRTSRRPALAIVGGLAAAVLIAGALAPGFGTDPQGGTPNAPFVAGDASAAEVLERAAELQADGTASGGSGTTWHAVSRGSDGSVYETWYDADRGTVRWARYWPGDAPPSRTDAAGDSYYVLDAHADGSGTIRQYARYGDGWIAQEGGAQMDDAAADAAGRPVGLGVVSVEREAIAWLQAIGRATDDAERRAANLRFATATTMWFSPPTSATDPLEVRAATRANQALFLLRIAKVEPHAVAQLYRDVADLESLERLADATVDGRRVLRLRLYVPPTDGGGHTLENVLLLDAETGAPVGTQNEDGSRSSTHAPARRTAAIGDDPASCGEADQPPCELLRGEGPLAARADRIAAASAQPLDPTPAPGADQGNAVGGGPIAPAQ